MSSSAPWEELISEQIILNLHAEVIKRFGGDASTVAKDGCIDRSLGAAYNAELYSAQESAVFGLCFCGCLLYYIAQNHCFIDGNKRVAWAACTRALLSLGLRIETDDDEAEQFVLLISSGLVKSATDAAVWLADRVEAVE